MIGVAIYRSTGMADIDILYHTYCMCVHWRRCLACLWCVGHKRALSSWCMKIDGAVLHELFEIWTDFLCGCGCVYGWMDVCAQEYLKLSDVYKMYGNGCIPAQTAFPNALCLPLAVTSDTPREVWLLHSLFHPWQNVFLAFPPPFSLSSAIYF